LWLFCCYLSVSTNARVTQTEIRSTPTPLADTRRAGLKLRSPSPSTRWSKPPGRRPGKAKRVHALSSFQRTKAPLAALSCFHTDAHRCASPRHPGFPATGSKGFRFRFGGAL
jgi:hypothetical protein